MINLETPDELLERSVDRALELMKAQPDPIASAANLLGRWVEQDGAFQPVIQRIVEDYLRAIVTERAAVAGVKEAREEAKEKAASA
jgi:hypothetical protein